MPIKGWTFRFFFKKRKKKKEVWVLGKNMHQQSWIVKFTRVTSITAIIYCNNNPLKITWFLYMPTKQTETISKPFTTIHDEITRLLPSDNHWKISKILGYFYIDYMLLYIRFKQPHAARNLPTLVDVICKAP